MKFNTTVTIREDWNPHSLKSYDLGDVSPIQLGEFLEKYVNDETLVVTIQLWNRAKIERIQDQYVRS